MFLARQPNRRAVRCTVLAKGCPVHSAGGALSGLAPVVASNTPYSDLYKRCVAHIQIHIMSPRSCWGGNEQFHCDAEVSLLLYGSGYACSYRVDLSCCILYLTHSKSFRTPCTTCCHLMPDVHAIYMTCESSHSAAPKVLSWRDSVVAVGGGWGTHFVEPLCGVALSVPHATRVGTLSSSAIRLASGACETVRRGRRRAFRS